MKNRWLLIVILVVLLLSVLLFAASTMVNYTSYSDAAPFPILVGISQANLIEPWRVTMNDEMVREASKNPDIKLIVTDAAMDTERQKEDVEKMLGYGIDLLIISPNDTEQMAEWISQIHKQIPVIVLDRNMPGADYTQYIGPDNLQIGRLAGEHVRELLGREGGNLVEIKGREDDPSTRDRSVGFHEVVDRHPEIVVRKALTANWMQDQAEDRMKEYLPIATEPIDIIFAYNDSMGYGASIAMESFRFSKALIIGVDGLAGEQGGLELVKKGILCATITCPTGGQQAVESALRILRGETDIPHEIILKPLLITE